jgi:NlpC/P60 family
MTATKRCPRCGRVKAAEDFYRRRGGRRLSPYCQPCTQATSGRCDGAGGRTRPRPCGCGRWIGAASAATVPWAAGRVRTGDRPNGAAPSGPGWRAGRPGRGHGPGRPGRPHAKALRGLLAGGGAAIAWPAAPAAPAIRRPTPGAARAVAFALRQRGKPYQWGAQGPGAYDCSGLTWAAWRAAGVTIPRTAAGQLAGLPRVRGRLRPGDLVIYPSRGPSRRHVAMVVVPAQETFALHLLSGIWIAARPTCGYQLTTARTQERCEQRASRRRCPVCRP